MPFLVVNNVKLSCSYGTCSSKLKVSPLGALSGYLGLDLSIPQVALDLSASFAIPNGVVKTFDAMGNLMSQSIYVGGVLEGESLVFNAAGEITQKIMFAGGEIHGMVSMYTKGVLTAAISFKKGLMHGKSKFYNLQGKLALETNFAGDLEDGLQISFDVDTGAILEKKLFVKGMLQGALQADLSLDLDMDLKADLSGGLGMDLEADLSAGLDIDIDMDMEVGGVAAIDGQLMATVMDHSANVNIQPFCLCKSRANPAVAAATKKAHGVLKPQPCTPKTKSPWVPGSHAVTLQNYPALTNSSKLMCAYGGVIRIKDAGQKKATVT